MTDATPDASRPARVGSAYDAMAYIEAAREHRGLSQRALARRAGCGSSTYVGWANITRPDRESTNMHIPSLRHTFAVLRALGYDMVLRPRDYVPTRPAERPAAAPTPAIVDVPLPGMPEDVIDALAADEQANGEVRTRVGLGVYRVDSPQ